MHSVIVCYLPLVLYFNVLLAGNKFYQNDLNTAEEFYFEFVKCSSINGGIPSSFSKSGQIDFNQWISQNSVLVTDFSNYKLPSDDDVPKTLQVTFKNTSRQQCNYMCFMYYEKLVKVDVEAGNVVVN